MEPRALRWAGLCPGGLEVVVALGPTLELTSLEVAPALAAEDPGPPPGMHETPAAAELRRAVARCARGAAGAPEALVGRLARLAALWRRSRRSAPLLGTADAAGGGRALAAPRCFVERVGSDHAEVSWEPLGGGEAAAGFEVELRGCRAGLGAGAAGQGEAGLASLGCFRVPGGASVRSYRLRRLQPLRYHHVRVRAVGSGGGWASPWSREVSFKTLSVPAARAAGHAGTAAGFFAPSERAIAAAVCARGPPSAAQPGEAEDGGGLLPTAAEVARLRAQVLQDQLGEAFGPATGRAVKDLLDARLYRGGKGEFVRLGARYSRPPTTRAQRMERMRLVIAAEELYGPACADGNPWSMGPLYYEEVPRGAPLAAALGGA